MTRRFVILALVMFSPAWTALAQQGAAVEFLELFGMLDGNNDMAIERSEVPEKGREAFDRLAKIADANKDGRIELAEYRDALQKARDSAVAGGLNRPGGMTMFANMDRNGDGKVSREEFRGPAQLFDRLDADKDGQVTPAEARRLREQDGALVGQAAGAAARLNAMDKDGDGKVDREEFNGPVFLFNRIDRNQNGTLESEEIRGFRPEGQPARKKAQIQRKEDAKPATDTPGRDSNSQGGPSETET